MLLTILFLTEKLAATVISSRRRVYRACNYATDKSWQRLPYQPAVKPEMMYSYAANFAALHCTKDLGWNRVSLSGCTSIPCPSVSSISNLKFFYLIILYKYPKWCNNFTLIKYQAMSVAWFRRLTSCLAENVILVICVYLGDALSWNFNIEKTSKQLIAQDDASYEDRKSCIR